MPLVVDRPVLEGNYAWLASPDSLAPDCSAGLNDVQCDLDALAARRPMMIHRKNRHLRSTRRGLAALASACILFLTGAGAHAQTVKAGEVSGTLVSASALAGDTVLTVPSDKAFVLTQVVQRGHPCVRAQGRQPRHPFEHQRR
jgi:hypothetical protein